LSKLGVQSWGGHIATFHDHSRNELQLAQYATADGRNR
jgi:hypothetical protein